MNLPPSLFVFVGNALVIYGTDFILTGNIGYALVGINLFMAYQLYQTPAMQIHFPVTEPIGKVPPMLESAFFKAQNIRKSPQRDLNEVKIKQNAADNENLVRDQMENVIVKIERNSELLKKPLPKIR